MKKWTTLLLTVAMILPLVACTSGSAPSPAEQTQAPVANDETQDIPSDYSTPIHVSMCVTDSEKHGTHARNDFIKDKFNLTFEYVPVNSADWNERIRTWISTDDAPDLIWWNLKGAQANEYKTWARQGAFTPFEAEWFDDRPNLKAVYESSPSIDALSVDGTLYAWPSLRDNPPEAESCYSSNWCYRRDWAKALNLYKEDDIYTYDEWIELVRAVVEEDPGNNGPGMTAGLVMMPNNFPGAASLFLNAPVAEGNETCAYTLIDGEYVWPPSTEDYKESVKTTYDLYQEGLIYRDNILFKSMEYRDMIEAGLAFATYNVNGSLNVITERMVRDGTIEKQEDFGVAIILGRDGDWYMIQTEDYWCVTPFSHNTEEEAIQRVLDFWEWIMTDDGIRFRWMGIEGTDFNRTGDGLRDVELLWEKDPATGGYIDPYANFAFNEAQAAQNIRSNPPGSVPYQYDEIDRMWSIRASGRIPTKVKPFDYFVSFGSAENKDRNGDFGLITKERIVNLMAQPNIDIEAEWDKYVTEMMPRVQPVLDEINGGQLK